jgi:hypothetical protein
MSAFEALLIQAHALGAQFALKRDRLLVQAPAPLPAALLAELRQHKPAIVAAFKERCGCCGSRQVWVAPSGNIHCIEVCHAVFNAHRGGWSPGDSPFRRPATHAEVDTMEHL